MLRRLGDAAGSYAASVKIKDAAFPAPFVSGLEYNCPAHGTWNIVHTGMLVPESHQIFVCTSNCNRGVVLTAAEMGAMDRFSTIAIEENDILFGNLEKQIIDGVTDIIEKLPVRPRAVLVFTSCVHDFMGCDINMVYSTLRSRFPDVKIADCYMDVIRKKTGHTAEQMVRRGIYNMLDGCPVNGKSVNIIGNNLPTDKTSQLCELIAGAGCEVKELPLCHSFDEFMAMGSSFLNITTQPVSAFAADILRRRFGTPHLYMPNSFDYGKITQSLHSLACMLETDPPDYGQEIQACEKELDSVKKTIGDMPIALDHNFTPLFLSLARMLVEHGFNLRRIYADSFLPEERDDFVWLEHNAGDIDVYATIHPNMRTAIRSTDETYLALGQKAAFFTGTEHFINVVEGGGMYGFDGIRRLCSLMLEAYSEKKDTHIIQRKGLGGACCL